MTLSDSFHFLMLFAVMIIACDECNPKNNPANYNAETTAKGVTVHGFGCDGWIKNNNENPVLIQYIQRGAQNKGETTRWVKNLNTDQKIPMRITNNSGFYIFSADGNRLLGFIYPEANGREE